MLAMALQRPLRPDPVLTQSMLDIFKACKNSCAKHEVKLVVTVAGMVLAIVFIVVFGAFLSDPHLDLNYNSEPSDVRQERV